MNGQPIRAFHEWSDGTKEDGEMRSEGLMRVRRTTPLGVEPCVASDGEENQFYGRSDANGQPS